MRFLGVMNKKGTTIIKQEKKGGLVTGEYISNLKEVKDVVVPVITTLSANEELVESKEVKVKTRYELYCDWMVNRGQEPSEEDYKIKVIFKNW